MLFSFSDQQGYEGGEQCLLSACYQRLDVSLLRSTLQLLYNSANGLSPGRSVLLLGRILLWLLVRELNLYPSLSLLPPKFLLFSFSLMSCLFHCEITTVAVSQLAASCLDGIGFYQYKHLNPDYSASRG